MRFLRVVIFSLIGCAIGGDLNLFAQESKDELLGRVSVSQALKNRGVSLDTQSLINALSNSNPQIRGLAAYQLASTKSVEAIGPLETALALEKDDFQALRIAQSLMILNSSAGKKYILASCGDTSKRAMVRISGIRSLSADDMQEASRVCAEPLLQIVETSREWADRANAMTEIARMYSSVSVPTQNRIDAEALKALHDGNNSVRTSSVAVLAQSHSKDSSAELLRARDSDPDPNFRAYIAHWLANHSSDK